jgi:signal peptidase I
MPSNIVRSCVWAILVIGVLVGAARLTCLRWWRVPDNDLDLSASVAPTLGAGDWVILWRLTPPGFGDLVLCPDPEEPGEVVVGRIAAEGGDTLSISEDGSLTVNGERMRSEHSCKDSTVLVDHPRTGKPTELRCDVETIGAVHHRRGRAPSTVIKPVLVKTDVEREHLFLVSDNRSHPFDSRDFGALPNASCSETVVFRLVSRLGFSDARSRLSWIQ